MKALLLLLLRAGSSELQQEEATELRGVGVNVVDLFWRRLRGANSNSSSSPLTRLRTRNISLIRFAASPYCPNDFALWGLSDEDGVFAAADAAQRRAKLQCEPRRSVGVCGRPRRGKAGRVDG